jgi:hypothetical protein
MARRLQYPRPQAEPSVGARPGNSHVAILHPLHRSQEVVMDKAFKVGDHVSWNSEAGRVSGRITRVHTKDVSYKGYVHHASEDDPQFEIKSDKTDHVAIHKGKALQHIRR